MIRHIRTFPLSDSEIKQLERDLTGMALEAEKRGEDFEDVLDMTPTEFCDELLYSIGGSKAPGGRYLLKGAGIYYQLTGILGTALFSLILLLALFYKGKYVQAENKNAAKAEASTLDEYGNRVEATHITVENTSPFELKNVRVKFNGETAVKNISVEKDGKATVKLPKTDKPITKVEIEGTTSYGKKFTNFFSGCISNKSCIVVYLTETMDLGVTANIE